jgi:hypothetical protein
MLLCVNMHCRVGESCWQYGHSFLLITSAALSKPATCYVLHCFCGCLCVAVWQASMLVPPLLNEEQACYHLCAAVPLECVWYWVWWPQQNTQVLRQVHIDCLVVGWLPLLQSPSKFWQPRWLQSECKLVSACLSAGWFCGAHVAIC